MILDGFLVAKEKRAQLKTYVQTLEAQYHVIPSLAIIMVGNQMASKTYVKNKLKACQDVGIREILISFEETVSQDVLIQKIHEINEDKLIHGVIVQLPLPKHLNEFEILNSIAFNKDVDGFTLYNQGMLFKGREALRAATPQGILDLLSYYQIEVSGKHVVVVGRSQIVGLPIAKMMLDLNATVTVCHSRTKHLETHTKMADIIIAAVGKAHMITRDMVKEGAIVIDVGINRNEEGLLVGDVDFKSVSHLASWITPVPRGVGPMTIYALLENTVKACIRQENLNVKIE